MPVTLSAEAISTMIGGAAVVDTPTHDGVGRCRRRSLAGGRRSAGGAGLRRSALCPHPRGEDTPPPPTTLLEDWVREPVDSEELRTRRAAAAQRAACSALPVLDDGLLLFRGRLVRHPSWPRKSMMALLVDRFGLVTTKEELARAAAASGGSCSPARPSRRRSARLGQRLVPLGLELCSIRGRGYLLQAVGAVPSPRHRECRPDRKARETAHPTAGRPSGWSPPKRRRNRLSLRSGIVHRSAWGEREPEEGHAEESVDRPRPGGVERGCAHRSGHGTGGGGTAHCRKQCRRCSTTSGC